MDGPVRRSKRSTGPFRSLREPQLTRQKSPTGDFWARGAAKRRAIRDATASRTSNMRLRIFAAIPPAPPFPSALRLETAPPCGIPRRSPRLEAFAARSICRVPTVAKRRRRRSPLRLRQIPITLSKNRLPLPKGPTTLSAHHRRLCSIALAWAKAVRPLCANRAIFQVAALAGRVGTKARSRRRAA